MEEISQDLLKKFKAPAYPESFLLSFEGIEGAGKSTQLLKLKKFLEEKNFRVLILREPGGTPFGEKLRSAILNTKTPIHPLAEVYLFTASRVQLLDEVTLKELNVPNTVIIYDRYIDSTLAYQGMGRDLGVKTILEIHQNPPLNLIPHLTFYLKISLDTSLERQEKRNQDRDYFESQGRDFYQKLIDGYDMASELFSERIIVLDGEKDEGQVADDIKGHVNQLILK
ncbi:MAG: dTMP kinase [Epsilonproteobacteria bacterium]|nr:MAG: dTMP kinase [Campylobacterota bacterium]RLA66029.1 MAG: dTMP kinase [Campylobacterota bacterium]